MAEAEVKTHFMLLIPSWRCVLQADVHIKHRLREVHGHSYRRQIWCAPNLGALSDLLSRKLITCSTLTDKNSVITVTEPPAILMKLGAVSCYSLSPRCIIHITNWFHYWTFHHYSLADVLLFFWKPFYEFSKKRQEKSFNIVGKAIRIIWIKKKKKE